MIYSDRQYGVSSAALAKLRTALEAAEREGSNGGWLKKAEVDGLKSQIADIEAEMSEYDMLKSGQIAFSKSYALEALPTVLVQARIASGLTQTDLAEKLGMKPQQVQRYEATNYVGASLGRLVEVSQALGVKTSGTFASRTPTASSVFAWNDVEDIVWSQLPYREMIKRGWFDVPRGTNPLDRVKEYFIASGGSQIATALHRKKMRSGNVPNEYALIAWQVRVLELARAVEKRVSEFEPDESWLSELVRLTQRDDGPRRAGRLLAEHGIALIIEPHLPGSYLDGAAMLTHGDRPVIALTLRYDRLDNFWFVLFHELAHVFLHLFDGLRYDFFDEESASDDDDIEVQADRFALNRLIPEEMWERCLSRFALSKEAVRMDAENLGIAESIIAGRIRKELNNYTILGDVVGQGKVRGQFLEAEK